jgi:aryl-alcohol dehydrogenase-like predicted oxidoreductase
MKQRRLGRHGPMVSAMGLGCASMGTIYGPTDEEEALATIRRALDLGINFLDTSDAYGPHTNERLVGKAIAGRRDEVVLSTKVGIFADPDGPGGMGVNGRPDYIRSAIDASLKRLQVDMVDLYYLHRVDPHVPVEETVGAMAEQVAAGKVRWLGLSETSAATLERAVSVHPIIAMESEYSLWARDPEESVLDACRVKGVALVAYSPLGRAMLTGTLRSEDELDADDYRRRLPKFQGGNFTGNLAAVDKLQAFAAGRGHSPAQIALAWLLAQGDDIVPIPGTKRRRYLEENAAAADIDLSAEDIAALDAIFVGSIAGSRYGEAAQAVWSS